MFAGLPAPEVFVGIKKTKAMNKMGKKQIFLK
jgi:hypothetical protein